MINLTSQIKSIIIQALIPDIVRSCNLSPASDQAIINDVWVPVAPGIQYEDLPDPPVIIDTSPDQIIGCIVDTTNNPQGRLNALFPDAESGDGVIERRNNDIWKYDGSIWQNVGPNPGQTVVYERVVPFWNEKVIITGLTKTGISTQGYNYSLSLSSAIQIKTKTKVSAPKTKLIDLPVTIQIGVSPAAPISAGRATRETTEILKQSGTAAPLLGNTQAVVESAQSYGWELIFNNTEDEGSVETGQFGFNFTLNNVQYNKCFVNSNGYITFGGVENTYAALGEDSPSLPKIHLGSGDWSYQRVYTKRDNFVYRIRWEGNSAYSAPAGSSNRFLEISFYETLESGTQFVEVRTGNINGSVAGPFMIATATTALADGTGTFTANSSWVFSGNSIGTTWTLEAATYIDYNVFIALSIPTTNINVSALNIVSNKIINTPLSVVNANPIPPDMIGRQRTEVPASLSSIAVATIQPSVVTGHSIISPVINIGIGASGPIVASGKSFGISSSVIATQVNVPAVSIQTPTRILPSATQINATPLIPGISIGHIVAVPVAVISILDIDPAIASGSSVPVPISTITLASVVPSIIALSADPYYSNVSLLLHMDGSNGSTTFTDSSSTGRTVTVNGNAQISTAQSKFGGAAGLLDGNGDYLEVADSSDWPVGTNDFTIEGWFNFSAATSGVSYALVMQGTTSFTSNAGFAFLRHDSNKLRFIFTDDGTGASGYKIIDSTATFTPVTGTWYHLAVTRDINTFRLFVDGTQVGSATFSQAIFNSTRPLSIGADDNGAIAFNGYIDELRITSNLARYVNNFTPSTTSFPNSAPTDIYFSNVSLLLHGDGVNNGTIFTDNSTNNFALTRGGNTVTSNTRRKFGYTSILFDGSSDYLQVPSNAAFSFDGDFTIELWVYQDSSPVQTYPIILERGATTSSSNYGIILDNSTATTTGAFFYDAVRAYVGLGSFAKDTWIHVAVTRSGSTLRTFNNGTLVSSQTVSNNFTSSATLIIGGNGGLTANWFEGNLDEIRITKGLARYTSSFAVQTAPFPNS